MLSHEGSTAVAAKVRAQPSVHSVRSRLHLTVLTRCPMVQEWMDRYLQDKASATAELLTLLVQARQSLATLGLSKPVVRPASCMSR